jgi:hypothetical protein
METSAATHHWAGTITILRISSRCSVQFHIAIAPPIWRAGVDEVSAELPSTRNHLSEEAPRWLDLSEQALLEDCRFDAFRGPGPGGQKRNKSSNSIRLAHAPTGITVIAGESRSQVENKLRAIRRLKLRLATDIRRPIDPRFFEPPPWFKDVTQLGRLAVSHRNEHYARTAALVLDLFDSRRGNVGDVAKLLGVSTSSVVRFLAEEPQLWAAANAIRQNCGQTPLRARE